MSERQPTERRVYEFKALTSLWTGDIDGKPDRLITTGLLGSIRWWFEVLVRGLGGGACDPIQHDCVDRDHCVVCELFGCTGWARKFRFDVLDTNGRPRKAQITKDTSFKLRFTPLRSICDKEWALLDLTLRLIANYGALGGKTVYKPTDEAHRQAKQHHQDFGLVKLIHGPDVSKFSKDELRAYMRDWLVDVGGNGFAWASLEHFWFVDRRLARTSSNSSPFNRVIGRKEPKNQAQELVESNDTNKWLAGSTGNSKKAFSFSVQPRAFGFVKPGVVEHEQMKARLKTAWSDLANEDYQTGNGILDRLLASPEASS